MRLPIVVAGELQDADSRRIEMSARSPRSERGMTRSTSSGSLASAERRKRIPAPLRSAGGSRPEAAIPLDCLLQTFAAEDRHPHNARQPKFYLADGSVSGHARNRLRGFDMLGNLR
jgi:hypothetical protein